MISLRGMQTTFSLLLLVPVITAVYEADRIINLPGLTEDINFKQYSGFLQTDSGKYLHYWLVESQEAPESAPLVIWLNGGPGCSSLTGLLEENGPFRIDSKGMKLYLNPQSWNRVANMLYIEAPAGVGFSYSNTGNYTIDDDQTADDNLSALRDFYRKFIEYRGRALYVTGESYGGIYVPTLASRILNEPDFNIKGFAVGNGMSDWLLNNNSMAYFAYYHGLIGTKKWNSLIETCCEGENVLRCPFTQMARTNKKCDHLFSAVYMLMWQSGLNPYNLYSECIGGVPRSSVVVFGSQNKQVLRNSALPKPISISAQQGLKSRDDTSDASTSPCGNSTATVLYLNRADVRHALHVPETVKFWAPCSLTVSETYWTTYDNVHNEYVKALDKGLRILVYNGDVDMACNFLGDEWFVDALPIKAISGQKEWYYVDESGSRQVAGMVQQYEGLNFVTIRGSGHFVPTDKPIPAFDMFRKFIENEAY